jgi:hypothetical protein
MPRHVVSPRALLWRALSRGLSSSAVASAGVLGGLLPSCARSPRGATLTALQSPAVADSVFARYYRAIGGIDCVLAVSSRQMWGTYTEGRLIARTDIAWGRPQSRRVNVHAPGFEYAEGYDGHTWEFNFQTHRLVVDSGASADAGRRGAEFDESFVSHARKGHAVEVLGTALLNGRRTTRVQVRLADGWTKEYLFDQESGLIAAMRKAMPIHATGPVVESLTGYEDWRPVGGCLTPHRFVERESATGRLLNTLQWDSIRTNLPLAPRQLGRPEEPSLPDTTFAEPLSLGVAAETPRGGGSRPVRALQVRPRPAVPGRAAPASENVAAI